MPLHSKQLNKEIITNWFKELQANICSGLEKVDGKGTFLKDDWIREQGGGGRTCVMKDGHILAKGGVAFSAVHGPASSQMMRTLQMPYEEGEAENINFLATGVSIVIHPHSPNVPIIHMNVRYFELSNGVWWFGGGIDLTPHYVTPALAKLFHQKLKAVCDKHNPIFYSLFKKWADEYFYIKHRNEMRGIGGIFFDRLNESFAAAPCSKEQAWAFVQDVGNVFVELYAEQIQATKDLPFGDNEKRWQSIRRSRYVEFNLVWDRGTHFGLQTNGRTESILMSMPPMAEWFYNEQPSEGSKEAETLQYFAPGRDWINQ